MVEKNSLPLATPCIQWAGGLNNCGYGQIRRNGKTQLAHRLAYQEVHGPIPIGKQVLHRCDNPSCVNPEHLFLGTHLDNMRDMNAKGRNRGADVTRKFSAEVREQIRSATGNWKDLCAKFSISRACFYRIRNGG